MWTCASVAALFMPENEPLIVSLAPSSVAAFHLAMAPDDTLYVTAPTLGTYDVLYRVDHDGNVTTVDAPLGRPQPLTCAGRGFAPCARGRRPGLGLE